MNRYETCGEPSRRHDFLLLFDVSDGNPNGDPDAGNMPRIDPETAQGLVTDVCLKRKVRDYVRLAQSDADLYRIYIQNDGVALNTKHEEAYKAENIKSTGTKQKRDDVLKARDRMCRADVRTRRHRQHVRRQADDRPRGARPRAGRCNIYDDRRFGEQK